MPGDASAITTNFHGIPQLKGEEGRGQQEGRSMTAREADESDEMRQDGARCSLNEATPHLFRLSQMTRPWQRSMQRKATVCKQWSRLCISLCHEEGDNL